MAASISPGDALTSEGVRLGSDRGGGAREQERQSNAGNRSDGSEVNGNGRGKGGKGHGKGKGKGKGKGRGKGKGHGHGQGKNAGGGGAYIIFDRNGREHLLAWSERR